MLTEPKKTEQTNIKEVSAILNDCIQGILVQKYALPDTLGFNMASE